jgi:hypothetical protein
MRTYILGLGSDLGTCDEVQDFARTVLQDMLVLVVVLFWDWEEAPVWRRET